MTTAMSRSGESTVRVYHDGADADACNKSPWCKSIIADDSVSPRSSAYYNATHVDGHARDRPTAVVDRRVRPAGIARHPFSGRLNTILDTHGFDRFAEGQCREFYAKVMGRPGLPPGQYFRLLLVG